MAEILGKDLDKYDDSDIANAPFNLVESEIAGPRFMTGQDLSRSAKISAEWKMPIAIPSQAKSDRTVVEEISSSFLTGASDVVAQEFDNARNTLAQTYLESGILGNVKRLADMGAGSSGRTIGEGLSRLLGYDMPDDKNKDKLETYDKIVDILEGRVYPLDKYARRVIANATDSVESRKIVRELYNQAQGIDSSKLYNQGATILGAMAPTLTLTKGAYGAGRAFGASRIAATNLATNVAKGYIGVEMAGQYAEETAAQYRERTGDTNFENFTAKDAKGLSAIAYGAIGSQIEFMGGVEPIMAGALNKVGLRSSLLSAGLKIGAGEATEEFLQGITETLMRKIDNTSDKTWAEGFKEALQGAGWGVVIGGGLGLTSFYTNRRNLVKGIKTALPNIRDEEAKLVADAMIDSTAEMITQNPTLRSNLREKVAMMYRDSDIDNKEQNIDAITDLEYSLITMDAAERGIELSEHEIFGGVVNELGWFRKGIPENRIAEVQELNNEIKSLKEELAKENAQEEKNWEKIDELETKLAQSNQYILDKISDLARDDARAIRRILRETEGRYVKREKERATKKAIKSGNVDMIAEILSKAGFKTRDMSGTTIKELARLNWELLQDKDLGQAQSRGTVQRKLADIEANVESGNTVLLRAGYTQEQIDKMDDETWNRAILTQYRKEQPTTDEDLVPDEALEELPDNFFQSEVFSVADENARLDDIYPAYDGETIEVDGKERTVYNSNGDRIAKSKEALTNFWQWFGDSKVVDEQGRPLVVYHGTNNKRGFSKFDKNKISTYRFGKGFYFSEIKRVAEIYSNLNNHKTMQVYLKIENPYFISKDETPKALKYFADKGMANKGLLSDAEWQEMLNTSYPEHALETAEGMASENKDFSEYPKSEGYDGIIYTYEQGPEKDAFAEIVAFEPNQIKSVDNRGTFSSDTGNIYFQSAYAGSAVDYDRPSLEAIGSGEGVQAHGWGLYYALNPEIAENYMLASRASYEANKIRSLDEEFETLKVEGKPILDVYDIDIDRTLLDLLTWKPYGVVEEELEKRISKWEQLSKDPDYKFKDYADKKVNAYKKLKSDLYNNGMSLIQKDRGQVHEVDIPEFDVLLDEQKNLGQQSQFVQKAVKKALKEAGITEITENSTGGEIYEALREYHQSAKDASQMLEKYGIKGITYEGRIDGRCFVIFNPESVKVLRKKFDELGNVLFQNRVSGGAPATYRGAYIPAYRFIQRSNRMDASTLSHELAHDWMEVNFARYRDGTATPDFMRAWGALEKALGIEEDATQVPRQASETFARAYEAWITSNEDWSKFIAVEDKDKDKVEKLLQDYQGELRNIYNDINNKYFKETWGKLGELKPELKAWFDRVVNITDLDVLVERGELTPAQAENEKLNRAIDTVIESTTDEDATKELRKARLLNDTSRYEVEGGNQNSLQNRLSALAREIDDNNMTLKGERYNTRRDMMQVAEAADNFVKTRLEDALAIINGEMAEVEGLYKEDIYTALERLAVETGDMNLISELKNSEIANQLAKELGQRVAGFRNWKQSTEIDVFSALKSLDNNFNKALKNKKAQKQFDSALDLLDESLQNQDKVADKQLDSMLKEWECQ